MANYYTTYLLKGKYTDKEVLSRHILSYMSVSHGFQLADFMCFTNTIIKSKKVKLVLVIADASFSPVNFAGLEEISYQIEKMQSHGIAVYLYASSYNMSTLYLAAKTDKSLIHPVGNICFGGFYKNQFSATQLLNKLGIKFIINKTGMLKDTFAIFGDDVPKSDYSQWLLQDYEHAFLQQIERHPCGKELYKKLSEQKILSASEVKNIGFLNETITLPEVFQRIAERGFSPRKVNILLKNKKSWWKKNVAIVFVNGELVDGTGVPIMNGTKKTINSGRIIGIINYLKQKPSIKAVLLRIDSTGGTSNAGYDLYHAIKKLSKVKLTVVSIGNYATSAAYWMSLGGNIVFANATSVIGAVGAVTAKPYILEAMNKAGIQMTSEKLKDADVINLFEEYSDATRDGIKKWLNGILIYFLDAIKEHYNPDEETLNIVSSGCSFSGYYAWKHGLIDQLGGIEQALQYIHNQLEEAPVRYLYYPENKVPFLYRKLFHMNIK